MFGRSWTNRKHKPGVDDEDSSTSTRRTMDSSSNTSSTSDRYQAINSYGVHTGDTYPPPPNSTRHEDPFVPITARRVQQGSWWIDHDVSSASSFRPRHILMGQMNLLTACRNGNYTVVEKLLKRGDDVNKTDCSQDHSVTPLHTALIHGHDAIVELLLKHGADVHRAANNGWTPLHIAASNGRANVVEWLLDHHANLEAKDARGWTPLFVACFRGHLAVVRLLLLDKRYVLTMHPQVNWTDAHGQTPLMTACQRGHLHIVNILLQLGAQTWLQDEDGSTALNFAAEGYPEIVMALLEHDMIVKANAMVRLNQSHEQQRQENVQQQQQE